MALYMICDKDGNALTDGLHENDAYQVAQSIADSRRESVWLSQHDNDDKGVEFFPYLTLVDAPRK